MSLNAAIDWEIRQDGSDLNGGGYKRTAGTTDYSQQAAAQLALTDLACASNTTLTSATGGFTAAMVGMLAGGVFDHFYFNIEQFHATMTTVWIIMGLMLAATRLAVERAILAAAEAEP